MVLFRRLLGDVLRERRLRAGPDPASGLRRGPGQPGLHLRDRARPEGSLLRAARLAVLRARRAAVRGAARRVRRGRPRGGRHRADAAHGPSSGRGVRVRCLTRSDVGSVTPSAGVKPMESRPPVPPFTRDAAVAKVRGAEDGWNTRDPQRVALGLHARQPVAEPLGVLPGATGDHRLPDPEVGQGAGLPADQGDVGVRLGPDRGALRLRVARPGRRVVPFLRQRELAVRRRTA